ncbi:MurR/RpiR family transcriptional regulator [Rhizobium sp. NRK18]|uniref:MurR/RpiR family transcriptional regulator n=1 Tax=Rhizobium sp. NRK18 TaxID=2964667 RepID=UPI0021C3AF0E|nr:MurR/RpiR family transcriptional regulator [Rhizobium sp. NRK18]MCQ2006089.1 MurR/RpiR family transcriptional regulator [Rhizobium sp. NRK18]
MRRFSISAFLDQLKAYAADGTPAERRLARFFLDNLADIPFETAASIATKMDLSPMTVGRFLRRLGFQGVDGLKSELRSGAVSSAWQLTDRIETLREDLKAGRLMAELMQEQVETLHRLYEMSNQERWISAVDMILGAREIFIASYQNIGGIARYFAEQLSYARDGVRYMDGLNGTYVELLGHPADDTLLILIDARRFASKSRILASEAANAGHRMLVITDQHCDWLDPERHRALILPPATARTWDSFMSLAALLDFLMTSVVIAGGDAVAERTRRIEALQDRFGDFDRK